MRLRAAWVFPVVIFLSVAVHGAALLLGRVRQERPTALPDQSAEVVALVLVEPAPPIEFSPPEPTPIPKPPTLDPVPPEPPPVEPVISKPEPEPARPAATPLPAVKPQPRPVAEPKPEKPAPRTPASRAIVQARPDIAHNPPPRYPEMARRKGWEGSVMVRAHVSAAGRVTAVSLHRSCSYGVLNQAALAAVKSWRFRPGSMGGQAADTVVEVPVNFSLRR